MQENNLSSHLKLHLIVFIWGFTAVLGALISIDSDALVWYRMLLATITLLGIVFYKKKSLKIPVKQIVRLSFVGLLIALHWIFFFEAIHISTVSVTLAVFSVGSFLAALLEPLFYNRKILWYEVAFGVLIILGLGLILKVEINYLQGIIYSFIAITIGVIFTLLNGKLIQNQDATVLTFYEFLSGVGFITIYFLCTQKFTTAFFEVSNTDWILLLLLSTICTAYAFTASIAIMKKISPYTVMLTTSLEPVYGIILAYFIIGNKEKMSLEFYLGTVLIVITVILNGIVKHRLNRK